MQYSTCILKFVMGLWKYGLNLAFKVKKCFPIYSDDQWKAWGFIKASLSYPELALK